MSRHFTQQEENFWPCVSDMFLALFIIALALYSGRGEGDTRSIEHIVDETNAIIKELQTAFPDDEDVGKIEKIEYEEEREEGHDEKNCPLSVALTSILNSQELQKTLERQPPHSCDGTCDHSKAIKNFYQFLFGRDGKMMDNDNVLISKAHLELTTIFLRRKHQQELRVAIEQERNKMREQYDQETKISDARKETINEQQREIDKLKKELGVDMRKKIMETVADKFSELIRNKMVEIDKEKGVIRIPSDTLAFVQGVMEREDEVLGNFTEEKLKRMSNGERERIKHIWFRNHTNIQKIADALKGVMEEDKRTNLIDTIIIEGHADSTGNSETNETVSCQRAVGTWIYLKECYHDFEDYQNANGRKIFGLAGFGSRNPLDKREGEGSEDYQKRCRRIDIRFVPTPKKTY